MSNLGLYSTRPLMCRFSILLIISTRSCGDITYWGLAMVSLTLKTFNLPPIGYIRMGPMSVLGDPWFPICPIWGCIQHFQLLPLVQLLYKRENKGIFANSAHEFYGSRPIWISDDYHLLPKQRRLVFRVYIFLSKSLNMEFGR